MEFFKVGEEVVKVWDYESTAGKVETLPDNSR